jgi:toxin CcdB
MPRFDVHRIADRGQGSRVAYVLDIQADLLSGLATRLVVPLVPVSDFGPPVKRLNPVFRIGNRNFVMATAELAAIPSKLIGERVASLAGESDDIVAALDFLISGI